MPIQFVLLPLFVEVLLTFGVMFGMMYFRTSSLRRGDDAISRTSRCASRTGRARARNSPIAFANQFELPVLFYVLTILSIVTHHADFVFVVLAWIFVVMRVLQAVVHVTSNNVRLRGAFYGVGAMILVIMWVIFIVRIMLALP